VNFVLLLPFVPYSIHSFIRKKRRKKKSGKQPSPRKFTAALMKWLQTGAVICAFSTLRSHSQDVLCTQPESCKNTDFRLGIICLWYLTHFFSLVLCSDSLAAPFVYGHICTGINEVAKSPLPGLGGSISLAFGPL